MNKIILFSGYLILAGFLSVGSTLPHNTATVQELAQSNPSPMTIRRLEKILKEVAGEVRSQNGQFRFEFQGNSILVLTSASQDRMRIITPITDTPNLSTEQLHKMMIANFHTALDARYAISDGVVYAALIHPLSSLAERDLRSAISQVANLAATFGTSYSSGELLFNPGSPPRRVKPPNS